jgi:hypothetical protein
MSGWTPLHHAAREGLIERVAGCSARMYALGIIFLIVVTAH